MAEQVKIPRNKIEDYCKRALQAAGVNEDDASRVMDCLLFGDTGGISSHGVRWIPVYVQRLRSGGINPGAQPVLISDRGATCLVDAGGGLGHVAAYHATGLAIGKAKQFGIGLASVKNSNHFGAAGYYARMAVDEGLIAIVTTNATPLMAAWGAATALLGTNPVSFGIPLAGTGGMLLDMATSEAARGKIFLAKAKGEAIPPGWALDAEGRPTRDPDEALKGVLLPVAGPKGSGLAIIIEALSGALSGSLCGTEIPSLFGEPSRPQNIGHMIIAIDPGFLCGREEFDSRVGVLADSIHGARLAEGFRRIYLPGEVEAERRAGEGGVISLPVQIFKELLDTGGALGLEAGELLQFIPGVPGA